MPRFAHLVPDPYQVGTLQADGFAVVALHGFTASPGEMRFLADHLADHGHEVHGLLLPGHGTTEQELLHTTRQQWLQAVDACVGQLHSDGKRVVIMGQSLGGALGLHVAAHNPAVVGVVAFAPALRLPWLASLASLASPLVSTFPKHEQRHNDFVDKAQLQQLWSYERTPLRTVAELAGLAKETLAHLHQVRCPTLLYSAAHDAMISQRSVAQLAARLPNSQHIHLDRSGHVIPLDAARHDVAAGVVQWLTALSTQGSVTKPTSR
jgi:carboxylesterase